MASKNSDLVDPTQEACELCDHVYPTEKPCELCNTDHPTKPDKLTCYCCGNGHRRIAGNPLNCNVPGCENCDMTATLFHKECVNGHPANGGWGCTVSGCDGNVQEQYGLSDSDKDEIDQTMGLVGGGGKDDSGEYAQWQAKRAASEAWEREAEMWRLDGGGVASTDKTTVIGGPGKGKGKGKGKKGKGEGTSTSVSTSSYSSHGHSGWESKYASKQSCVHDANVRTIGGFEVLLGGASRGLKSEHYALADVIIPLTTGGPAMVWGKPHLILPMHLQDYGGVPAGWKETLEDTVVPIIKSGKKVLAFCLGSHGRTGCFAGSLIALMEPDIEDPVAEIRKRHCSHAVETLAQVKAIFACKGTDVPEKYIKEYTYTPPKGAVTPSYDGKYTANDWEGMMLIGNQPWYLWPHGTWCAEKPPKQFFLVKPKKGAVGWWDALMDGDEVLASVFASTVFDAKTQYKDLGNIGPGNAPLVPQEWKRLSMDDNPLTAAPEDKVYGIFYNDKLKMPCRYTIENVAGYADLVKSGDIKIYTIQTDGRTTTDIPMFTNWRTAELLQKHLAVAYASTKDDLSIRVLALAPKKKADVVAISSAVETAKADAATAETVETTPPPTPKSDQLPVGAWRVHANGGGMVSTSATVEPTVFVDVRARVDGKASVTGMSAILQNAVVGDLAIVHDAVVSGAARVGGTATICAGSLIGGAAIVGGHSVIQSSLYSGTWHDVTVRRPFYKGWTSEPCWAPYLIPSGTGQLPDKFWSTFEKRSIAASNSADDIYEEEAS